MAAEGGKVYARRDEQPTNFELDDETVPFVCESLENYIELRFMRLARSQIAAVRIQGSAGDLRLMPGVSGGSIAAAREEGEGGPAYDVDPLALKDLLAAAEEAEVTRSFIDLEAEAFFPEGGDETVFWVEGLGGERYGGRFGAKRALPDGTEVTPYLRFQSGSVRRSRPSSVRSSTGRWRPTCRGRSGRRRTPGFVRSPSRAAAVRRGSSGGIPSTGGSPPPRSPRGSWTRSSSSFCSSRRRSTSHLAGRPSTWNSQSS